VRATARLGLDLAVAHGLDLGASVLAKIVVAISPVLVGVLLLLLVIIVFIAKMIAVPTASAEYALIRAIITIKIIDSTAVFLLRDYE
jgi:hypothetical protein